MADEKRLIDAKPLMQNGWHLVRTGESNKFLASMSLADVPTVDAVEVVRCKNCRQSEKWGGQLFCRRWGADWHAVSENAFCYYGERRG